MLKAPQFMIRYANNKIGRIWDNAALTDEEKNKAIRAIDHAVTNYELGYLTMDETMKTIAIA